MQYDYFLDSSYATITNKNLIKRLNVQTQLADFESIPLLNQLYDGPVGSNFCFITQCDLSSFQGKLFSLTVLHCSRCQKKKKRVVATNVFPIKPSIVHSPYKSRNISNFISFFKCFYRPYHLTDPDTLKYLKCGGGTVANDILISPQSFCHLPHVEWRSVFTNQHDFTCPSCALQNVENGYRKFYTNSSFVALAQNKPLSDSVYHPRPSYEFSPYVSDSYQLINIFDYVLISACQVCHAPAYIVNRNAFWTFNITHQQ